MDIEAFLADAVQASGGKLHALGIGWQVIQTTAFPARHDRVGIGLIVRTVAAEAGQHTLTLTPSKPPSPRRTVPGRRPSRSISTAWASRRRARPRSPWRSAERSGPPGGSGSRLHR